MRGIAISGIILSLLSALGLSGCGMNDFKPAADAVITEMSISYSGMSYDSHYFFSLRTQGTAVVFNGEYSSSNAEGEIIKHCYDEVSVDPSYMDELRSLAADKDLVNSIKKYREAKLKIQPLDGDMKSTSITMSDNTQKTAATIFDSDYHTFFVSIAEAYADHDSGDKPTEVLGD